MRGRRIRWQMAAIARPTRKINESDVNISFPPFCTGTITRNAREKKAGDPVIFSQKSSALYKRFWFPKGVLHSLSVFYLISIDL